MTSQASSSQFNFDMAESYSGRIHELYVIQVLSHTRTHIYTRQEDLSRVGASKLARCITVDQVCFLNKQDFQRCLKLIDDALAETGGQHEYALHAKGLIKREEGDIRESLKLFQSAINLNPGNLSNMKELGRSLHLLDKHKAAIKIFEEVSAMAADDDWVRECTGKKGSSPKIVLKALSLSIILL